MSSIKSYIISFLTCILLILTSCSSEEKVRPIKVGVMAGPEAEIMKVAKDVSKKYFDLDVQIVEFSDYSMPNTALAEGTIDANLFQHQPFLNVIIEKKKYDLTPIGKVFIYPMGIYSKRHNTLIDIPKGAKIGIPSDPTNEGRALRLLANAKLIVIPEDIDDVDLTPQKVRENPFYIKFKEMDAAQLPRALGDLDYAVINTNYALNAGLRPYPDAIMMENADSPYANLLVVRTADKDDPRFKELLRALHSKSVQEKANELFMNQAIPAWSK